MKLLLSIGSIIGSIGASLFVLSVPTLISLSANAEPERCDEFSVGLSKSSLEKVPVTVLRAGASPILQIAQHTYHYDVKKRCLVEGEALAKDGCGQPQKIMDGKKVIAVIEGSPKAMIFAVDEKGKKDDTQAHYELAVLKDPVAKLRPQFWMAAVSADGKTLGQINSTEGKTVEQLNKTKGKLATAHSGLIDLRDKQLVYTNCRKLTVSHYQEVPSRAIASLKKK